MLKSFSKAVPLLLAVGLILATLSGCNVKSPDSTANEKRSGSTAESGKQTQEATKDPYAKYAPQKDKKYSITWTTYQLAPIDKDAEMIKYWNEKFNVDIKVWDIENAKWDEIMNLKFAAGEIADKIRITNTSNYMKYIDEQILTDIPLEVLKKYAPNLYKKAQDEAPGIWDYAIVKDKIYGLPSINADWMLRGPVSWRGDWLKNVGITKTPETLDEFEQALYKFADGDPNKNGKKDTYGLSASSLTPVYGAFGYLPNYWEVKDQKLVYGAVQPEMKNALKLINKWYKDGVLDPEFITGENLGGHWSLSHAFINGRIGLTSMGSYVHWKPLLYEGDVIAGTYGELVKTNKAIADAIVRGNPPKGPNGKMASPSNNAFSGAFDGFGKHLEKEPDKMGKILEIMDYICGTSSENYLMAVYGIKGKHWTSENGLPQRKLTNVQEAAMGAQTTMQVVGLPSFAMELMPGRIQWGIDNGYKVGAVQNKLRWPLPSDGKYKAELQKIQDEAYISNITGDKPIDYFDTFVKNWENAGGKQLTEEANKWYSKK